MNNSSWIVAYLQFAEFSRFSIHSNFPKIDHSGSTAIIVFEQNKFSEKVTSNRE